MHVSAIALLVKDWGHYDHSKNGKVSTCLQLLQNHRIVNKYILYIMKLWVWYVHRTNYRPSHDMTLHHMKSPDMKSHHFISPRNHSHYLTSHHLANNHITSCHVASMTSYHITSQHITWPPPTHHEGTTTHHQNTTTRPNGCRVPGRFFFPLKLPPPFTNI